MATWKSFTVILPKRTNGWNRSSLGDISVWGNGNNGQDLWGWPSAGAMHTDNIVAYPDGSAVVAVHLDQQSDSTQFSIVMRLTRDGASEVFCQFFE